ncbi:hypothetical protein IT570_03960 [Candidatus Sumerlaeota bacterium]|nr:hypothetical protein [Candidatus Sumerlaeota bacterium]
MNQTETSSRSERNQNDFYAILQNRYVRITLCVLMIGAFIWNGSRYRARHGFDAGSHTKFADVIAEEHRIPTLEEAYVSYNPPLFYAYAAMLNRLSVAMGGNKDEEKFLAKMTPEINRIKGEMAATDDAKTKRSLGRDLDDIDVERREKKFGGARNFTKVTLGVLVGIMVILAMSLSGRMLGAKSKTAYLLLLLSIPALFKYPAMYTPESFLTVMVWGSMLVGLWNFPPKYQVPQAIVAGLLGAAAIWTRPFGFAVAGAWGLTLIVALVIWKNGGRRWALRAGIICAICAVAGAGLFAYNGKRTGKTMPRPKQSEAMFNKLPLSFYIGIRPMNLLLNPYRDDSPDQLLTSKEQEGGTAKVKAPTLNSWYTILYADSYGDYWKYWTLNHRLNNEEISKGFWRFALIIQMLASLVPFGIMLAGAVILSRKALKAGADDPLALFVPIGSLLVVGLLFFLYFVISTPANEFNQVKALYIHFLLPAIPFGGAFLVSQWIEKRDSGKFWALPYLMAFCAWSFIIFGIYWH